MLPCQSGARSKELPMRARSTLSLLGALVLLLGALVAPASSTQIDQQSSGYDSDHILVGWDRGLPEEARADVHRQEGGEVANRLEAIDVDVVKVPDNQDPN